MNGFPFHLFIIRRNTFETKNLFLKNSFTKKPDTSADRDAIVRIVKIIA